MGVKVRERPKGSGVWWIFVDHKGTRKAKKIGKDRKLAEKVKDVMEANLKLDRPLMGKEEEPPVPTIRAYYKQFKENYMATTLKLTTFEGYDSSYRNYILPQLGKHRIDQIDRTKMQSFVRGLLDKGLAKDSIRLILAALSVLYSDAVENEIVVKNPTIGMGKFYRQAPKKHEEIEPLTEEEVIQLLEATLKYAPDQYPLLLGALHTGMRSGELAGLQWGDIDWNGKFLKVRRNFVRGRVGTLKTKNGRRRVDLSDELIETLGNLRRTKRKEALARGRNEIPEWIFSNRRGNPADMHNLKRRYFRKVLRKAGLRSIRFHDLRHTYASLLLAQGQPLTYVSQQLGHANPQITLKIYAHWIPNRSQREAVNRLPTLKPMRSREVDPMNAEASFR